MVGSTAGDDSLTYKQWLPRIEATIVCMFIVVIILFIPTKIAEFGKQNKY